MNKPRRQVRFAAVSGFTAGAAVGAALFLAGCGAGLPKQDTLGDSVRTYSEGIRWERYAASASRLPPSDRAAFVDQWDSRSKDVKVTDYEMLQIMKRSDKHARVQVKISWYKDSEGIVHETTAMQSWERKGKVWWMVEQHRMHGPEMPGLPERDPDADPNADYETDDDAAALADTPKHPG